MIYGSVIQTHPAIEPVTLEEFKSYLRIEGAGEDRELIEVAFGLPLRDWLASYQLVGKVTAYQGIDG